MTDAPARVSLEDQAKECEREVVMRRRVYARWVESGKMTQSAADTAIARMDAAAATLRRLAEEEKAKGRLL
jgi:hypothetical protein